MRPLHGPDVVAPPASAQTTTGKGRAPAPGRPRVTHRELRVAPTAAPLDASRLDTADAWLGGALSAAGVTLADVAALREIVPSLVGRAESDAADRVRLAVDPLGLALDEGGTRLSAQTRSRLTTLRRRLATRELPNVPDRLTLELPARREPSL